MSCQRRFECRPTAPKQWRRWAIAAVAAAVAALCASSAAQAASVLITVDKTNQRLSVAVNGVPRYEWPVSTAREGYNTPNGTYGVERLARTWYSRRYDWSPMPHSIFFSGGYAIHGSYEIRRLGSPASHGCIRLHPGNAAVLYELVQQNTRSTRIVVIGDRPWRAPVARQQPARVRQPPQAAIYRDRQHYVEEQYSAPRTIRGRRARYRESFEEIFN